MKSSVSFLFLVVFCALHTLGQKVEITVHNRVDTLNQEVGEVLALWRNYLSSKPDSIYDNPYWNSEEKKTHYDFDLSRKFLYPFSSEQLLNYYRPTVLSIEKEGEVFAIRTMFAADGLEGEYRGSNPWSITKIYAIEENGKWKLKNALPILSNNWQRKTIGKINFVYSTSHVFDRAQAEKAVRFCDSITQKFRLPNWEAFDFYVTESGDELGQLLGFDFFFSGYTTGMSLPGKRILLSGLGSEYYPHELVHMIVPDKSRHGMINEGIATWLGGVNQKSLAEATDGLQAALTEDVGFADILNKKWGWQESAYYVVGALICQDVYSKKGVEGVNLLLDVSTDNYALAQQITDLLEIEAHELDAWLRDALLRFGSN